MLKFLIATTLAFSALFPISAAYASSVQESPEEQEAILRQAIENHWATRAYQRQCGKLTNAAPAGQPPAERGYYLGGRFLAPARSARVMYFLHSVSGFEVPFSAEIPNSRFAEQLEQLKNSIGTQVCVTVVEEDYVWTLDERSIIEPAAS